MHPLVKKLMAKKKLSGKEMAILQIANWVEKDLGGEAVSFDEMLPILNKSSMYANEAEYKKYMNVEYELQSMNVFYCEKLEQASLACTALQLLYEAIYHANFANCNWKKYELDKLHNEISLHRNLLKKLDVSYCSCLAIQAGFKAASEWLEVSKLEKTLPNLNNLNEQIAAINGRANKLLISLKKKEGALKMLDYACFFKRLDLPELKTTKEDVNNAKAMFVLNDFGKTFDESIDAIYDAIQERKREKELIDSNEITTFVKKISIPNSDI